MSLTGIVDGLPILDYVKDPAPAPSLSASLAHVLLTRSPKHAWLASPRLSGTCELEEYDAKKIVGTVAHALLLEGDRSRVVTIEADSFQSKAARALRDEALLSGKLPVLAERMADVDAAVEAARAQLAVTELPDLFTGGHAERTMIWQDGGVWYRSRPDWISADGTVLADLKTTSTAEPDAWARGPLLGYEFDLQATLALCGADALLGSAERTFIFVVLEVTPPYGLSLVGLTPAYRTFAASKLDRAAAIWRECLATSHWPGYPTRVAWAEPPSWATYRWDERLLRDDGAGEVSEL